MQNLLAIQNDLNTAEMRNLSPAATHSVDALRREEEEKDGHRQSFSLDADRILHSRAYSRYIDKTQVFWLVSNDHITHRIIHVQLVSRIARTIGRFLFLNEDLIEAIALGHDIGHPPFGHEGERFLSEICEQHGLPAFQHNIQSVRFLDNLEKKGRGWNLSLQTLDGILCHDGEIHSRHLTAAPSCDFQDFDRKLADKEADPATNLTPMTLEACVVRLADTIAYIGRDIEDAIILGLIKREDIPNHCRDVLGETNGTIVYNLVTDLISNSFLPLPGDYSFTGIPHIGFSERVSEALYQLKQFNYTSIYLNPCTKQASPLIKNCYEKLFLSFLAHLKKNNNRFSPQVDLMTDMGETYRKTHPPEAMVRDFIAGMTDDFFLQEAAKIGCAIPQKQ
ncbi:MAG: HD domain-containing protein [Desulfopila sp.]|nr:HD domain-containing protein [Desulfopila sp.]